MGKLGIIEAILYVMVVGMSVDFVGGSILSGAMSTIIGIAWLLLATIAFFVKFGAFICFLIAVSLTFSMLTFTAAMSAIGPEEDSGDIVVFYRNCRRKRQGRASSRTHDDSSVEEN